MGAYLAHSKNEQGLTDPLCDHLENVSHIAAEFAKDFGASEEARLAGLLHDLGKYGELFQKRLQGLETGIDHWSPGAWTAFSRYGAAGFAATFGIRGHHVGLGRISTAEAKKLNPEVLREYHPQNLRLSDVHVETLVRRLEEDAIELPPPEEVSSGYIALHNQKRRAASMLYVRMLFSALVDADFLDTEAHFRGTADTPRLYRENGPALDPDNALFRLLQHVDSVAGKSKASDQVLRMRKDLLEACLKAADEAPGTFTLTAPTGAGKTLSMLAFALKHAARHGLRRVVMVIPYLSIIEQTADVYRKVFAPHVSLEHLAGYVLEHHSLAGTRDNDQQDDGDRERLLAENWDAPIIITTSVQFLESLFANRPSSCRKLHNIAHSVVLFDEVQTLPEGLVVPTLAALSALSDICGASVVFATATQPAFDHLDGAVRELFVEGWEPKEIVPAELELFDRARRTRVRWPRDPQAGESWESVADRLCSGSPQSLCIVNLKRHALELFTLLKDKRAEGLFHLSTSMCPAHRVQTLDHVRRLLKDKRPCRLISTQCVEAGVDLDFPVVYRALGPLDSIAQAAGRCNRNGCQRSGDVQVFVPEDEAYPGGGYARAAAVARIMLCSCREGLDIDDPEVFGEYYRRLYELSRPDQHKPDLVEAIKRQDFGETAQLYRVIPDNTVNVLVPYDRKQFSILADEARSGGLSAGWIKRARPYSVGIYRPRIDAAVRKSLEAVPLADGTLSTDWFIYLAEDHYDASVGLAPPGSMETLIA